MGLQDQLANYSPNVPEQLSTDASAPMQPIPTDGGQVPFVPVASDRNAEILAQQEAADKPVPYPSGTAAFERNDHPFSRAMPAENHSAAPPPGDLYDSGGKITEYGRSQLSGPHTKVAPVATPLDTSPVSTGQPQASAAAQQTQRADDGLMAMLQAQGRGGGGGDPFKNRNASLQEQMRRADEVRDMRTDAGTFNAGELQKQASAMDRYSAEAKTRGESQTKEAEGKEGAFVKAAEESAADRINPNHYKESRGAFQAGIDMLGGIFGGLGSVKGGPNEFIDHLHKKIGADIDAQKQNHDIKTEGVNAKKTAYGMMLDKFGNQNVAAHAAHAAELEKWRALGDARAALDTNVDAQERWAIERSKIDHEIATNRDKAIAAGQAGGMSLEKMVELRNKILQGNQTQANIDKMNRDASAGPEASKLAVNTPGGSREAISDNAQQTYTQIQRGAVGVQRELDELEQLRKAPFSPANAHRAQSLAAQIKQDFPALKGVNRSPTEGELHALESIVPSNANAWSPMGSTDAQLEELRKGVTGAMSDADATYLRPTAPSLQKQIANSATPPPGFQGVGK